MKKLCALFVCMLCLLGLCACGGDVSSVQVLQVPSEIYTQEEIDAAIRVIRRDFARNWSGCTLREIGYAGDEINRREGADEQEGQQVLVLTSSFDVDASGGDGSLNPDSSYSGWMWILQRTPGGRWRHVDHGY